MYRLILIIFAVVSMAADWQPMFDGKTMAGWRVTSFQNSGKVRVENGSLILANGAPMTGVTLEGKPPAGRYEVRWEAQRLNGSDFFSSLTFPVGESFCTFVTGGWGGDIVGLSSIDGWDASDNETRTYVTFESERWYAFRLQVTPERIAAWIDDKQVINVDIGGRAISLRPGDTKLSAPFGFMSYNSTGALRKIEWREIATPPK